MYRHPPVLFTHPFPTTRQDWTRPSHHGVLTYNRKKYSAYLAAKSEKEVFETVKGKPPPAFTSASSH